MTAATVVVIAKAPFPGQVKTRLCPPLSARSAAAVAAAALADTLAVVRDTPGVRRVLALAGAPDGLVETDGFIVVQQRGETFGERLAHAFADAQPTEGPTRSPTLLIGMDTPQVRVDHLTDALTALMSAEAVLGPALDGGWWLLALAEPHLADVLRGVPMSTDTTGRRTRAALEDKGLTITDLEPLRDVDTIEDALDVAALIPGSRFAGALAVAIRAGRR